MNKSELKNIAEGLIEIFNIAGQESIDLYAKGLKIEIKEDNSPVSNGDLRANELITNKILELTPNIPIISEETVNLKIKNDCSKKTPKGEIVALDSSSHPSEEIMKELRKYNVTSVVEMASSYKFCVIANGEYDIYAAKERAKEWDYAAGHAIAEHAGAIIKTLDGGPFDYGKEDYNNPSILMRRAQKLDD